MDFFYLDESADRMNLTNPKFKESSITLYLVQEVKKETTIAPFVCVLC